MKELYVKFEKEWVRMDISKKGRKRSDVEIELIKRSNVRIGREVKEIER